MRIRKAALIGAGAVGAYLIWSFNGVSDITFTVVADGARKKRLERDGIVINGEHDPLRVREPDQSVRQQ